MLWQTGARPWEQREPDVGQWSRDLRQAAQVQTGLLAAEPTVAAGAAAFGCSIPLYSVGGDYYDFLPLPDGRLRVIVADVMGKGLGAALLITMMRGTARVLGPHAASPADFLKQLNDVLYPDLKRLESFIAVSCLDYAPSSHTAIISGAGAPYPLLLRAGTEAVETIKAKGIAVGILPNRNYAEHVVPVSDGDLLMIFSDGIIDLQNPDGTSLTIAGFGRMIQAKRDLVGFNLIEALLQDAISTTQDKVARDDVTVVAMHFGTGYTAEGRPAKVRAPVQSALGAK